MFLFLVAPTAPLWNLCSSTPSPRFTTCCCTRKELRWPFVWQMDCREWFPCWRRVTPSSWPSPQTVCSCCHTATRRARCVWIYYFSLHLLTLHNDCNLKPSTVPCVCVHVFCFGCGMRTEVFRCWLGVVVCLLSVMNWQVPGKSWLS